MGSDLRRRPGIRSLSEESVINQMRRLWTQLLRRPRGALALSSASNKARADALQADVLPALKVLAESLGLLRQSPAFQNWRSTDWLMGLTVLAQHNAQLRKAQPQTQGLVKGSKHTPQEAQELVQTLLRYVRVCDAVYADTTEDFCQEAHLDPSQIVRVLEGGVFAPKCVLLLDHERREIVLVVRGSASILDFCTDLCLVNEPFQHGQGHRGMVHAARWLVNQVQPDLEQLAQQHQEYDIVLTGHSLGASVAALAAMTLHEAFPRLHCYAFATPASVTEELAHACQDYVTSVVHGDDCVPRLHQHSLLRLQQQIATFDWRSALKSLLTAELEEQKSAVEKEKQERMDQIQQALQKLDSLKTQQQGGALAKLDALKRIAAENILEISSAVNKRMPASLLATSASFQMDAKALGQVEFIKKLVNQDSEPDWGWTEKSVSTLEKLAEAVQKPEELERVLREAKELLKKPDLPDSETPAAPSPSSLRDRLNKVIRSSSDTVEARVRGKITQWSDKVESKVQAYVGTVKGEADALGHAIQDELKSMQNEVKAKAQEKLPTEAMRKAFRIEALEVYRQYRERLEAEDAESEASESSQAPTTTPMAGPKAPTEEPAPTQPDQQPPPPAELLHAPLFPPGRIVYLNRLGASSSISSAMAAYVGGNRSIEQTQKIELVQVANDEFSRVVLSNDMILDHLCTTYERALKNPALLLSSSSESIASAQLK